jgi:hypothetical protein
MTEATTLVPQAVSGDDSLEQHRKEVFAHAVAFGVPIPQALVQASYEPATFALGAMLLKDEEVQRIISADREWMREKMKVSQEQIIAQLDRDREFAYLCDNPSAAVSATMNKAKVYGIADPSGGKGAPKRVIIEWNDSDVEIAEAG